MPVRAPTSSSGYPAGGPQRGVVANQPMFPRACRHRRLGQRCAGSSAFATRSKQPALRIRGRARVSSRETQRNTGGIIRHGAKLLYAFRRGHRAKISGITRQSLRWRYWRHALQGHRDRLQLRVSDGRDRGHGAEGAVNISIPRELAPDSPTRRAEKVAEYAATSPIPYIAARRGYVDDIIEPSETRPKRSRRSSCWRGSGRAAAQEHGNIRCSMRLLVANRGRNSRSHLPGRPHLQIETVP